jgi:hypothetical protein
MNNSTSKPPAAAWIRSSSTAAGFLLLSGAGRLRLLYTRTTYAPERSPEQPTTQPNKENAMQPIDEETLARHAEEAVNKYLSTDAQLGRIITDMIEAMGAGSDPTCSIPDDWSNRIMEEGLVPREYEDRLRALARARYQFIVDHEGFDQRPDGSWHGVWNLGTRVKPTARQLRRWRQSPGFENAKKEKMYADV